MQDYQLDKFFNVLPLANIISFPEYYWAFTFVHLDVSMRDALFSGGSRVAKLGFRDQCQMLHMFTIAGFLYIQLSIVSYQISCG